MRRAGADVYVQRGAGGETGQVAAWCRLRGRPFLFAAASDSNCERSVPRISKRERLLYRIGLSLADGVVCQSEHQRRRLRESFGIEAVLARSCAEDPCAAGGVGRDRTPPGGALRVLWIGRFSPEKRFELALELAARAPEMHLDVVGGRAGKAGYAEAVERRAMALANVSLHGWVPHDRVGAFYDRAHVLLCTSAVEGFPNTFLEAWARGTPTVSTVDPDGLIAHEGLGAVADGAERLHEALGRLLREPGRWTEASQRARRRFVEHHVPSRAGDTYETLLDDLVTRGSGGRPSRSGRAQPVRDRGAIGQEEERPNSLRALRSMRTS
jgi:glycosyltransferase involved in cell wall biosynthesis